MVLISTVHFLLKPYGFSSIIFYVHQVVHLPFMLLLRDVLVVSWEKLFTLSKHIVLNKISLCFNGPIVFCFAFSLSAEESSTDATLKVTDYNRLLPVLTDLKCVVRA